MPKTIKINDEIEADLLKAIEKRIATLYEKDENGKYLFMSEKQLKRYNILKEHLNFGCFYLKKADRALMMGIIYEHFIAPNKERINYFHSMLFVDILRIDESVQKEINFLNLMTQLHNDLGEKKDKISLIHSEYDSYFELIYFIQGKIYYSFDSHNENNIYKIGMPISKKEYVRLELADYDDDNFTNLNSKINKIDKSDMGFMKIGSRSEVIKRFVDSENENTSTKRREFVKELLIRAKSY